MSNQRFVVSVKIYPLHHGESFCPYFSFSLTRYKMNETIAIEIDVFIEYHVHSFYWLCHINSSHIYFMCT